MKLQIDATVIFALTSENNEFNRKLTFKDLKIDHNIILTNTKVFHQLPFHMSVLKQLKYC